MEADKENIDENPPLAQTTTGRGKTQREEIDNDFTNESQSVRRSKRIRGKPVVIHDSIPESGSETEVEQSQVNLLFLITQGFSTRN